MENEYQLRLKEMNHSDKVKEMTDKFVQEIDALKAKHAVSHRCRERLSACTTTQHKYLRTCSQCVVCS